MLRHLLLPFKLPFFDFLTSVSVDIDNLALLISKVNQVNSFFEHKGSSLKIYWLLSFIGVHHHHSLKREEDDEECGNKTTFIL